jgi:hypothetical protein
MCLHLVLLLEAKAVVFIFLQFAIDVMLKAADCMVKKHDYFVLNYKFLDLN